MSKDDDYVWETMIRHFSIVARAWPWVCGTAITTLVYCEKWRMEYLPLLAWPFFSFIGCIFLIMFASAYHVVADGRNIDKEKASRVMMTFFIASDIFCIWYCLKQGADPRSRLF